MSVEDEERGVDTLEGRIIAASADATEGLARARGLSLADAADRLRRSTDALMGVDPPPITVGRVVRRTWPVLLAVLGVLLLAFAGVFAHAIPGHGGRVTVGIIVGVTAVVIGQRLYRAGR